MPVEDLSVLWFPIWTRKLREQDYEGRCVRCFIVAEQGANQEVDLLETGCMFCVFAVRVLCSEFAVRCDCSRLDGS